MKLTIDGTPDEIQKVLQTIRSSEEHGLKINTNSFSQDHSSTLRRKGVIEDHEQK